MNKPIEFPTDGESFILYRKSLNEDIEALEKSKFSKWNWEPLLRGLRDHRETVKRVYLVGSDGERGSFNERETARDFLRGYFLESPHTVQFWPQGVPFESVEDLVYVIQDIITEEVDKFGTSLDQICVDVTGGQKTTSVAGVLATLKTPVLNQYVQTGNTRKVFLYDLRFETPIEFKGPP